MIPRIHIIRKTMNPTDKRFWIAWLVLLLMSIVSCMAGGWNEDTALLGAAYTLSLLSAWLCHRVRPRAALGNLIVMIVYNAIILRLQGNIGVAAYGVVANLSLVVVSIFTGIAQGMQPILSRVYGYGEHDSQKQILKYAFKTMLVISCVIYLIFILSANPIVSVFNSEQNVQLLQIAVTGLKLYFTAIPFVGFNIIISAYFTSTEKALPAQIISLSRGFLVIIPMAFFLSFLLKMTGVWLSFPITECFVTLTGIALYIKSENAPSLFLRN